MSHHPERTARNVSPVNQPPSFSFYEGGLISFEMLLDQLKVRNLFDQILLHTEKSIGLLKFVRSEEVTWVK